MDLDYQDIQGTILRGYRVEQARHFILQLTSRPEAGRWIQALLDGLPGLPTITTAQKGPVPARMFLNISFTCRGLALLGLTQNELDTFDASFRKGATHAETTEKLGDVGGSAPCHWQGGLNDADKVHAIVSLWVKQAQDLGPASTALRQAFKRYSVLELSCFDAQALPDDQVHFGFRDSIAQPDIIGAPPRKREIPDGQSPVKTGEFLLGHPNESNGAYSVQPPELSLNSSYAAFRVLGQDAKGFEAFLADESSKLGIDPELLAAKVCGRWRNGNPLTLCPEHPGATLPPQQLNNFHYVDQSIERDDTLGLKCPIGSHIRRSNPRDQQVTGSGSFLHRLVRRAMPYGPAYDAANPDSANQSRGLVGYFINASLANQFEFISAQWVLRSDFVKSATGPGGPDDGNAYFNISGQDVLIGVNHPGESRFTLPEPGPKGQNNKYILGFPRFIHTRGGAYCFFPSISGLRYLSKRAEQG